MKTYVNTQDNNCWSIREEIADVKANRNALGKSRRDIYSILTDCGFKEVIVSQLGYDRYKAGALKKIYLHFLEAKEWYDCTRHIKKGDTIVIQYPPINHSLLFSYVIRSWQKRGIRVVAFIHDLESIRLAANNRSTIKKRIRIRLEETSAVRIIDDLVVHNSLMKEYLSSTLGIREDKMICLNIFDYLCRDSTSTNVHSDYGSVTIAGNLTAEKAGYLMSLPEKPVFYLYGDNYKPLMQSNIQYKGAWDSEDIVYHIEGQYGLVWDGTSAKTCEGIYGNYLRYNNPHKTSLFLAAGIPVIVWKEAAIASFVQENKCGLIINSLNEIDDMIREITEEEYMQLKYNALKVGNKLRKGDYTINALKHLGLVNSCMNL